MEVLKTFGVDVLTFGGGVLLFVLLTLALVFCGCLVDVVVVVVVVETVFGVVV